MGNLARSIACPPLQPQLVELLFNVGALSDFKDDLFLVHSRCIRRFGLSHDTCDPTGQLQDITVEVVDDRIIVIDTITSSP